MEVCLTVISWDESIVRDRAVDVPTMVSDSDAEAAWSFMMRLLRLCIDHDSQCRVEVWDSGPNDVVKWATTLRDAGLDVKMPRRRWLFDARASGRLTKTALEALSASQFDHCQVQSRSGALMFKTLGTIEAFDVPFLTEEEVEGSYALHLRNGTLYFSREVDDG